MFGHLTKTEDKDAQSGGSVVLVTACHSLEASIGNWLLSNGMVEHRLKIQVVALFGIPINRKFQVFTGTIMMRCAVSLVIKVKLVQ